MYRLHTYLIKTSGAWRSTPVIIRQVSPESPKIFALIKELYQCCNGNWNFFLDQRLLGSNKSETEEFLQRFLWYAAKFLTWESTLSVFYLLPEIRANKDQVDAKNLHKRARRAKICPRRPWVNSRGYMLNIVESDGSLQRMFCSDALYNSCATWISQSRGTKCLLPGSRDSYGTRPRRYRCLYRQE